MSEIFSLLRKEQDSKNKEFSNSNLRNSWESKLRQDSGKATSKVPETKKKDVLGKDPEKGYGNQFLKSQVDHFKQLHEKTKDPVHKELLDAWKEKYKKSQKHFSDIEGLTPEDHLTLSKHHRNQELEFKEVNKALSAYHKNLADHHEESSKKENI